MRVAPKIIRLIMGALLIGAVSACSVAPPGVDFHDPNEQRNRQVHEANKEVDRGTLAPVAGVYGKIIPHEVDTVIGNVTDNLSLPSQAVNSLLQGDIKNVGIVSMRFLVNSTLGMGGIADPASELRLTHHETDFGETLYVWGVPEGSYQELPLFGPSTQRDTAGMIVDIVLDPMGHILPASVSKYTPALSVLEKVGDRNQYNDLIEDVLYNSEDSYAAARLYYLQSRRRALNGEVSDSDLEDPYAF